MGAADINLGTTERWVSMLAGSALLLTSKKRIDLGGAAAGSFGADLLERGLSGWCRSYAALGLTSIIEGTDPMNVRLQVSMALPATPRFTAMLGAMPHLPALARFVRLVERLEERRARFVAEAPFGTLLEWIAEADPAGTQIRIAWRSMPRSIVLHQGAATIAVNGVRAEADLELRFMPLRGAMSLAMAKVLDDLAVRTAEDLERWNQFAADELTMGLGRTQGQVTRARAERAQSAV